MNDKTLVERIVILERCKRRREASAKFVYSSKFALYVAIPFLFIEPMVSIALGIIANVIVFGATAVIRKNIRDLKRL